MQRLFGWILKLILRERLLFWAAFLTNLGGAAYGVFVWYKPMLDSSPAWAWPFIPVCPLAALAGSATLLGLRTGRRWPVLYALTSFACVMWGIWTLAFWTRQWLASGVVNPIEIALFIAHIGLICEGLLFVPQIGPISLAQRLLVLGWFWLSYFIHYGLGYHPPLTSHVSQPYIFWVSTLLLLPLSVALLLLPGTASRAQPSPSAA